MTSPVHIGSTGKYILILCKGSIQGLEGTRFTAEPKYLNNFAQSRKRFASSQHHNGSNSFLFVEWHKNLVTQSKIERNKGLLIVFTECFKRFYN